MTRDEAEQTAARRSREHPDRDRFSWMASPGPGGEWSVVRIGGAGWSPGKGLLKEGELAGEPRPSSEEMPPDEPQRSALWYAGGA